MWNNTYRNWSTSQKVKIIIFAKQIHILVIGLKPLTAHNKITSKIFPCKINTTENKTTNSAKQNKSRSKTRNVMAHSSKLRLFGESSMSHFIVRGDQSYSLVRDLINMQNVLNHISDRLSHLMGKRRKKLKFSAFGPSPKL